MNSHTPQHYPLPRITHQVVFLLVFIASLVTVHTGFACLMLSILFGYSLVNWMARHLPVRVEQFVGRHILASSVFATSVFTFLSVSILALFSAVRDSGGINAIIQLSLNSITSLQSQLPRFIVDALPTNLDITASSESYLHQHFKDISLAGLGLLKTCLLAFIGTFIGVLIALNPVNSQVLFRNPLLSLLVEQLSVLRNSFTSIFRAQFKISTINTALTAIYLLVVLPVAGVHLPFLVTVLQITFICGLIPVIGNLISNTVIVLLSVSVSLNVGLASLVFLVVVHKLEYFINAKIVGASTNARVWEVLLAIIFFEHAFGIAGVVMAPIWLAWFKSQWHLVEQGLPPPDSGQKSDPMLPLS